MAHDGTGAGWDTTAPANSDPRKDGAKEIRDLRIGVGTRLNREHETLASSSAGGEHKAGSAKAYYTGTAPTQRPDAATALDANDNGRLWEDTTGQNFLADGVTVNRGSPNSLKAWNNTNSVFELLSSCAWGTVPAGDGAGGYGPYSKLGFTPKVIVFSDSANGINFVVRCPTSGTGDAQPYASPYISGGSISLVSYIVDVDHDNKRFRVKIGTVNPGPDGGNIRYAAFA